MSLSFWLPATIRWYWKYTKHSTLLNYLWVLKKKRKRKNLWFLSGCFPLRSSIEFLSLLTPINFGYSVISLASSKRLLPKLFNFYQCLNTFPKCQQRNLLVSIFKKLSQQRHMFQIFSQARQYTPRFEHPDLNYIPQRQKLYAVENKIINYCCQNLHSISTR